MDPEAASSVTVDRDDEIVDRSVAFLRSNL
jgi:hypothetical protein